MKKQITSTEFVDFLKKQDALIGDASPNRLSLKAGEILVEVNDYIKKYFNLPETESFKTELDKYKALIKSRIRAEYELKNAGISDWENHEAISELDEAVECQRITLIYTYIDGRIEGKFPKRKKSIS